MRVEFTMEGGVGFFPGLSRPFVVTDDDLTEEEQTCLTSLIEEADFFALPEAAPASPMAADARSYTVTVQQGRRHSVQVADPVADPGMRRLVEYLSRLRREAQARTRAGNQSDTET